MRGTHPLNPTLDKTFDILAKLWADVLDALVTVTPWLGDNPRAAHEWRMCGGACGLDCGL